MCDTSTSRKRLGEANWIALHINSWRSPNSAIQSLPAHVPTTVPVAVYTRVSTAIQVGERFDSGESQAVICREHIAKHAADGWFEFASRVFPIRRAGLLL